MRKHFIPLSLSVLFILLVFGPLTFAAVADGCGDGGGGSSDIESLSASLDYTTGDITVVLNLCAGADSSTEYRVHFDHTAPFATDSDRNGDGEVDESDYCVTTSDDTMMQKGNKKATGPGVISISADVITYGVNIAELIAGLDIVNIAELIEELDIRDTVLIWADTQHKGPIDSAPDTAGCDKPDTAKEALSLSLLPCPLACVDAVNGWFAVLSTLHPPTYDEGFYFATWEGYGEGWMNALGPNHSTDGWVALFNVYSGQNPSCQAYWVAKIDGKLDEDHLLLYLTPEQAEACGGQLHPLFNVPETYF